MLQITAQVGIEEKGREGFLWHVPLSITEHDKTTILSSVQPENLFENQVFCSDEVVH